MRVAPKSEYYGVNQVGLSTSYGVAGRLGEQRARHMTADAAKADCKRRNAAYALGWQHAVERVAAVASEIPRP